MKNDKKKKLMAVLLAGSLLFSGATHAAAGEFSEYPEGMETDGGSDFDFGPDDFSEDPIPETEAYEAIREIPEDASESLPDSEQPGEAASAPAAYIEENVEAAEEETEKKEENGSDFDGDTGNTDKESNIRYVKGRPLTEAEIAQERALEVLTPGMIMPDEIEEENTRRDSFLLAYASELPEKYDAREKGLVTPVKNQNQGTSLGICWAFSMASLMETSLLMQGLGTYDLSEEHLAYFLYNRVNDPLGNTPNDHTYRYNNGDNISKTGYHKGGNGPMAMNHLSTWSGMTTEEDVPLPAATGATPPDDEKAYHAAAYLRNAGRTAYTVKNAKNLIFEYGSAGVHIYYQGAYLNSDTKAYACPQKQDINHMVTLVGWDDSYEKENFSASSNVTSDGAWIAKNSWGTKWGDNGYFYISYQDPSLLALITTEASIETVYPNNYFYDGSSLDLISVLPAGGSVANIYSVKADQTKAEILGEVTSYVASGDTTFTIEVYTDLKDLTDPCSGVLAAKLENVYQKYGGIFTRKIPETLLLPGTSYSVVLTAKPESKTLSIIVEASQNVSGQIVSEADIRPGQSFYREAGQEWTDLADGSPVRNKETGEIERKTPGCMRLKAHTRTISPELYLSETELSMYAGESSDVTVTLTPEIFEGNSFTVTSNHPEIAAAEITDSHILRVTANAPGTAVLTCKSVSVPGLSKTITVKVSLAAVQCKAKAKSGCVNTVSWNKISGAGGYYVYRKVYGKTWKRIAVIEKPSVVTYKDKDAEALTKYEYCVRAYRMVNQNIYKGDFIASDPVVTSPACQKIKTLTSVSGGIKLTWTPQKKASGYQIYRKTRSGKWILLKDLTKGTKNTFTDKTAKKNILYYYSVRAYVKQPDGSKLAGSYKAKSGLRM